MDYRDFYDIVKKKQENREKADDLFADASVFLYAALLEGKNLTEILKGASKLFDERLPKAPKTLKATFSANVKAVWRKASAPSEKPSETAFSAIDRADAFSFADKAANEWMREEETKAKDELFDESLKEPSVSGEIGKYRAFLLCSRHDDCAEDHKPYQGKLYVKRWALRYPEIKEFCEARGIKTVEWVIGKPAWLTTRPNCRHFFTEITAEEAMGKSVKWMLKEHGMDRIVGFQKGRNWKEAPYGTKKHSTQKQWYTEQNITRTIDAYKKRLKKHQKMAETYENENVRNAIAKDKMLIRKWEQYLVKMRKKGI